MKHPIADRSNAERPLRKVGRPFRLTPGKPANVLLAKPCILLQALALFCILCLVPSAGAWAGHWNPWVTNLSTTSATVNWKGNPQTTGELEYATETYFKVHQSFNKKVKSTKLDTFHHLSLPNLLPNTEYVYKAKPSDAPEVFLTRKFRTMPVSGPFTFLVISDTHAEEKRFKYVADAINKHEKDALFILDGGDYASYDKDSYWKHYFGYGEKMFGKFPIFHTIGNHEYHNRADPQGLPTHAEFYHHAYGIPKKGPLAYSFDCSDVRFVVLNSPDPKHHNGDDPQPNIALTKSQVPWLANQLDNKMAGTFTIHHHPIYQYGKTGVNPALGPWEALYQTYKISANFSGHAHDYERYSVRGIPYFIVGNAGGKFSNLMAGYPHSNWFEYGETKQIGYLKVSVDPENNTATAHEIYVAYVNSEYDETATVYDPPILADSVTFPLSSTLRTLTVVKSGLGKGTVKSPPRDGIDCGESCQAKYKRTETVVLSAIPDSNSLFSGWTGACKGHGRQCTVSVDEDITVAAIFETGCEYSFKPDNQTFSSTGGNITLTVTAQGKSCPAFDVSNTADWITYTQSEFARNKGTLTLTVADNTGTASRTANVFIGGNLFTVNQNARIFGFSPDSCSLSRR